MSSFSLQHGAADIGAYLSRRRRETESAEMGLLRPSFGIPILSQTFQQRPQGLSASTATCWQMRHWFSFLQFFCLICSFQCCSHTTFYVSKNVSCGILLVECRCSSKVVEIEIGRRQVGFEIVWLIGVGMQQCCPGSKTPQNCVCIHD